MGCKSIKKIGYKYDSVWEEFSIGYWISWLERDFHIMNFKVFGWIFIGHKSSKLFQEWAIESKYEDLFVPYTRF